MAGTIRIGTSGYVYDHWKGLFYPEDLPRSRWFEHYCGEFSTVEINNTFYRLPEARTFDKWHQAAPPGFRYALKYSRYATHMKKLKDPEGPLGKFLGRAERLKTYLGPILVQLPPHWEADPGRLEAFLKNAPRRHRWTVEFRDPSWLTPGILDILRRHEAALCIHDLIDNHPWEATAGWIYVRYHGSGERYGGGYTPQGLSADAERMDRFRRQGLDVYVYFNNDREGHAVRDAVKLRRYLAEEPPANSQ